MLTREEYEAKRQARYERLLSLAEKAEKESAQNWKQASLMADVIPFGQPILVGHYSERRDRRYRARIENKHRKGYELHQKAQYYQDRAEAMRNNTAIFSDDPDAAEKIAEKIARLEKRQEAMKQANKYIRQGNKAGLLEMGFSEDQITKLSDPTNFGGPGFPAFELTNNSANIRRLKDRAKIIEIHANDETSEKTINDVRIVDSVEDNRLQMYFPSRTSRQTYNDLKHAGFRWTPSLGCFQAYRSYHANRQAETIAQNWTKE